MSNYAIVIGINQYDNADVPPLTNPVDGALRMAAWLLTPGPSGGNVLLENLFLLLSPVPDPNEVHPGVDLKGLRVRHQLDRANQAIMKKAVAEMNRRVEGNRNGDRLYFYCSSHGLQA